MSDGKPSMEHTYDNGNIQGPAKEYDANGKIKRMGNMKTQRKPAKWQEFQDSVLVKKNNLIRKGKSLKKFR